MGQRRTLIVAVALVLAAVSALAAYAWLSGVEERAFEEAELVEVFRVTRDIPKGLPGEQAIDCCIEASRSPRKFRPTTAIVDLDSIRGRVALTPLPANTIVIEGMFVDPRQAQVTFAQGIPAGNVAISVSVDEVRGVANLLVPGDRVNVLVSDGSSMRTLYQNVEIIAVGSTAAPRPGEAPPPEGQAPEGDRGLITFAVPPEAAARIALAAQQSGLYLTLVPPDNPAIPVPPIGPGNLFNDDLTPYPG